jgi:hypothetical protein
MAKKMNAATDPARRHGFIDSIFSKVEGVRRAFMAVDAIHHRCSPLSICCWFGFASVEMNWVVFPLSSV